MEKIFEFGSSYFLGVIVILLIAIYGIRDIVLASKKQK